MPLDVELHESNRRPFLNLGKVIDRDGLERHGMSAAFPKVPTAALNRGGTEIEKVLLDFDSSRLVGSGETNRNNAFSELCVDIQQLESPRMGLKGHDSLKEPCKEDAVFPDVRTDIQGLMRAVEA